MFSFRRKPKKDAADKGPVIRASPSLPELSSQGIPWPENLVDLSALPPSESNATSSPSQSQFKGAERTTFSSPVRGTVPFHKPWSTGPGEGGGGKGTISSLYMNNNANGSHPPSAFANQKGSYKRSRPSQRRGRNPTTFNIMVVGAQGTGKTSLLRLLLDTADISPTATADQKANMERFLRGAPKRTETIQTACVEICESKYDRLLLSVIDTPGLDFQDGHELRLERQVSAIVKYMDTQFADTLSEESKVVRQSKGDQHIHLCIYTIDPSSITTEAARHARTSGGTRSDSIDGHAHKEALSGVADNVADEDEEDSWAHLTMSPVDIRIIRRLSKRANVLPVVARADSLTNEKLDMVKKIIRRDLAAAGLDFGVFGPVKAEDVPPQQRQRAQSEHLLTNGRHPNGTPTSPNGNGVHHDNDEGATAALAEEETQSDQEEERRSRTKVIKLRPARLPRRSSRSRTRLELSETANEAAEITDTESVASVRFSAHILSKADVSEMMPFALIAPEHVRRRRPLKAPRPVSSLSGVDDPQSELGHGAEGGGGHPSPSEDGHAVSVAESMIASPTSTRNNFSYLSGPPADLRGVFVRRYRWGTIDVLSPEHCDFAALRTAVLSTHMKMLKIRTKEVLYEKFRTEKLLARRATQNISEEQTRQILEGAFLTSLLSHFD
ncbi:hypothetical protein K474DRAFT_1598255 [Panus rudis PR-1116 ss-1]|nr:hypothetical protein K474DRAFT_1598255 [Panus rudis PR-1116 ss-1]